MHLGGEMLDLARDDKVTIIQKKSGSSQTMLGFSKMDTHKISKFVFSIMPLSASVNK